jgi:hypothetical protein
MSSDMEDPNELTHDIVAVTPRRIDQFKSGTDTTFAKLLTKLTPLASPRPGSRQGPPLSPRLQNPKILVQGSAFDAVTPRTGRKNKV